MIAHDDDTYSIPADDSKVVPGDNCQMYMSPTLKLFKLFMIKMLQSLCTVAAAQMNDDVMININQQLSF